MDKIIESAIYAPSSGNLQNWEFILISNKETKKEIAEIAHQEFIKESDKTIIACSNLSKIARYGERGKNLYGIQNVAAAIQNMLLMAWDYGIGSCWIGAFDDKKLSELLELPSYIIPQAIIVFGYPDELPDAPYRYPIKEILHKEKYGIQ